MLDAIFITAMLCSGFGAFLTGVVQNVRRGEHFGIALLLGSLYGLATVVLTSAILGTILTAYYQIYHHMPWLR